MKDTMLSRLVKKLGGTEVEVTAEAVTTIQSEFDAFKLSAEAEKLELSTALETAMQAVKDADVAVAALQAEVAALKSTVDEAKVSAEQTKATTRKEKIVAAVGTTKADALFTATESLADEQFNAVVESLTSAASVESKSKMFTEQGAAAEVDPSKVVEQSTEMKILLARRDELLKNN